MTERFFDLKNDVRRAPDADLVDIVDFIHEEMERRKKAIPPGWEVIHWSALIFEVVSPHGTIWMDQENRIFIGCQHHPYGSWENQQEFHDLTGAGIVDGIPRLVALVEKLIVQKVQEG